MERRYLAAACQLDSGPDVAANLGAGLALMRDAAGRGARLVGLPENFLYIGPDRFLAFDLDGPEVSAVREAARSLGLFVLAGSIQERCRDGDPRHYNTSLLFGPDGSQVARYRKLHLFDVELPGGARHDESEGVRPGSEVVAVETPLGAIGLSICYDLRFPELFRRLAASGARVLTVPSNFTLMTGKDHWEVLLRARAIENQAYVLAPAQIGEKHGGKVSFGRAMIVDPWGTVLAAAPERSGVAALAEIDMDHLERLRSLMPVASHARLGCEPG